MYSGPSVNRVTWATWRQTELCSRLCNVSLLFQRRRASNNDSHNKHGDLDRTGTSTPVAAVPGDASPWSRVQRTPEQIQTERIRGSERLTNLFRDDEVRHTLTHKPGVLLSGDGVGGPVTTIVGGADIGAPSTQMATSLPSGLTKPLDWDEDHAEALGATTESELAPVEVIEQELLDDAFAFFPSVHDAGVRRLEDGDDPQLAEAPTRYIPGQQIIPPGMTRYRVDVQYQGGDFDGWYKSCSRQLLRMEKQEDGSVRRVPVSIEGNSLTHNDVTEGGMGSRYHAKTVLEDALSVALDVPTVNVVASAIPETGVTVRRLTCHMDLPSDVEMQPRTIIQRATMWLQKRDQPLAILSCHRCKNQDFHARHSGVRRVYCYRILNRVAPPLFDAGLQWHVDRRLDVSRMQRFAKAMEGTKDYGYFADPKMANALRRAAVSVPGLSTAAYSAEHFQPVSLGLPRGATAAAPKSLIEKGLGNLDRAAALPTFNEYGQRVVSYNAKAQEYTKPQTNLPTVRTIDHIDVVRQEDEVLIWFIGKSFLRHQIRNMVSVLKASGHGLWDEHELDHAFRSGFEVSRKKFKRERLPAAPVHGLTLWDVEYPASHKDDYVPFVDSGPYEEVEISAWV